MEDDHRRVFERMQSELGDAGRDAGHASREDCGAYLSAVADLHGGEGSPSVAASLTGSESIEEILRLAISLEKKSILFYMGMEELFLRKSGGKEIAAVIDEEKSHIVILSKELYGCGSRQNG
jgi:rubrerythrin